MATYVAFTSLDGASTLEVNPEQVQSITPVPAELLPAGVPNGSYIESGDETTRVAVQGTVAATVNALGAAAGFSFVAFLGNGTITAARPAGVVVLRNGVGNYTITWPTNIGGAVASTGDGGGGTEANATVNIGGLAISDVYTHDAAGAAKDLDTFAIAFPTS